MLGEDHRGRAGHGGCRERRSAQLHVAVAENVVGPFGRERGAVGHCPDHVAARSRQVGLREAVQGVAPGRPRSRSVVFGAERVRDVRRADRDHERIVGRCERDVALLPVDCEVASGRDDRDAVQPQLLDRLIERVEEDARRVRRVQREVRDLDVVLALVRQDPVARCDDVCDGRLTGVVHDVDGEQVRVRGDARVSGCGACRDAGHEGAVPVGVAGPVRSEARERDLAEDPVTEVGRAGRIDAGVDDRDRRCLQRQGLSRPVDGCTGRPAPLLGVRRRQVDRAHLHGLVRHDRRDVLAHAQREDLPARQGGTSAVDRHELVLDLTRRDRVAARGRVLERLAQEAGGPFFPLALQDDVEGLLGVLLRRAQQGGGDVRLDVRRQGLDQCALQRRRGGRCSRRACSAAGGDEDARGGCKDDADSAAASTPERIRAFVAGQPNSSPHVFLSLNQTSA